MVPPLAEHAGSVRLVRARPDDERCRRASLLLLVVGGLTAEVDGGGDRDALPVRGPGDRRHPERQGRELPRLAAGRREQEDLWGVAVLAQEGELRSVRGPAGGRVVRPEGQLLGL